MIRKQSPNRAICLGDTGNAPRERRRPGREVKEARKARVAAIRVRMANWGYEFIEKCYKESFIPEWKEAAELELRERKKPQSGRKPTPRR